MKKSASAKIARPEKGVDRKRYGMKVDAEIASRLAGIEGHTKAVRRMWVEGAATPDVLQQISAVRQAWDKLASFVVLAHIEVAVRTGVSKHSSEAIFSELESTLMRYLGWQAKVIGGAHRHAVAQPNAPRSGKKHNASKALSSHRHVHRHADGIIHTHEHDHTDHWHPVLGTLVEPPLHRH